MFPFPAARSTLSCLVRHGSKSPAGCVGLSTKKEFYP